MKAEVSFPVAGHGVARDGGLFFIFEMANNHQGSLEHGLRIIQSMARVARAQGVQAAIKFQFRRLDSFLHPGFLDTFLPAPSNKHTRRFLETRLGFDDYRILAESARQQGLIPIATPFDEASVEWVERLDLPAVKIGSCSANDWPLLERVARTRRPVICSTGGLSLREVDEMVEFFQERKVPLAVLHCLGIYPAPRESLQLDQIRRLRERYPENVIGYSGHETPEDLEVAALAVAVGAAILERHVGVPGEGISLNAYSLSPEGVERWVQCALQAHRAMGAGRAARILPKEETRALEELKRGIYVKKEKLPGEFLRAEELFLAMPCLSGQFSAAELNEVIGLPVPPQGIGPRMPVMKNGNGKVPPEILLSSMTERVRGMLEASRIALAPGTTAEISHPRGVEKAERCGAVLIDIVNREYCKKIILQLPGQDHPLHRHNQKEETFHLLAGEMELEVEGKVQTLRPGDRFTVYRGLNHAFRTATGMIMEEISTTHHKNDSLYQDPAIPADPSLRKTRVAL